VLVLTDDDVAGLDHRVPDGWTRHRLAVDHAGARVH
jgi:hypothetical protein